MLIHEKSSNCNRKLLSSYSGCRCDDVLTVVLGPNLKVGRLEGRIKDRVPYTIKKISYNITVLTS